jgi:Cytosol aminopeptidase family, catalytic domain
LAQDHACHFPSQCWNGAATVDGVNLARDLVNEPPNVLHPEEFARRCEALRQLGAEVEVLDKARLEAIGMRTLLAVNQGSVLEPRVVIMWGPMPNNAWSTSISSNPRRNRVLCSIRIDNDWQRESYRLPDFASNKSRKAGLPFSSHPFPTSSLHETRRRSARARIGIR